MKDLKDNFTASVDSDGSDGREPFAIDDVDLAEVKELNVGALEEADRKIRENIVKVQANVKALLTNLNKAKFLSKELRHRIKDEIAGYQSQLNDLLSHKAPEYCRAAWLTLFLFEFSRDLLSRKEVKELLERLVEERRLVLDPNGTLEAYGQAYRVSEDSRLVDLEDLSKVQKGLNDLLQKVYAEVGKDRKERTKELLAQATIGWQGLVNGEHGACFLKVPSERLDNGTWRAGGNLLVHSDGASIVPTKAVGAIETLVEAMVDLGIRLWVSSLCRPEPPFIKGLPIEKGKKVRALWFVIQRAIRAEEEAEKFQATRQEFAGKATVTAQEFFLKQAPGTCLVEFQGVWETPAEEKVSNLFFLAERKEEKARISIVEVPSHLNQFFSPCLGREYEEGDKFEGVDQPLRAVLQACFGQAVGNNGTTS